MTHMPHQVRYESDGPAVVIHELRATHPSVVAEARHWTSGRRGPMAPDAELHDADLCEFVTQSLAVGAQAIAMAGDAQDAFCLEQLVDDVGRRTAEATSRAADRSGTAAAEAAQRMTDATAEAQKSMRATGEQARAALAETIGAAREDVRDQLTRIFGGEDPELMMRLKPLLDGFAERLSSSTDARVAELFARATLALDPDDPRSPFAKQRTALAEQHALLRATFEKQHDELSTSLQSLHTAVEVQKASMEAARATAQVTPLKGTSFEATVHPVLAAIATGLGDEYLDTTRTAGALPQCCKGDGLLVIAEDRARLLVEMHDAKRRRDWTAYLDEAERNRCAQASLGLVPTTDQNGGERVRVLGPRRVVLAFDAYADDPCLLRTTVQLLRLSALAAQRAHGEMEVQVATERITDALNTLPQIDAIRTDAASINKLASRVARSGESLQTTLNRLLVQAQTALAAVTPTGPEHPSVDGTG